MVPIGAQSDCRPLSRLGGADGSWPVDAEVVEQRSNPSGIASGQLCAEHLKSEHGRMVLAPSVPSLVSGLEEISRVTRYIPIRGRTPMTSPGTRLGHTSNGDSMDPVAAGAVVKVGEAGQKFADLAAAETGGLLRRLLGPSADVIGQDWADRLRQRNMDRLLRKTEKHAEGSPDPGWAQPRVAAAVFEAAQYANDEVVTDYLSGVLASSREPNGGTDDAVPWSNLVSRLSALQLRAHYVIYSSIRPVLQADSTKTRLYEFEDHALVLPMLDFLEAVGLDRGRSDFQRLADALQGMAQEDLIDGFAYGDRDFFSKQEGNVDKALEYLPRKRLDTPFEDVLKIRFSPFGVQLYLWGVGHGMAHDTDYLDPKRSYAVEGSDEGPTLEPLNDVGFMKDYWTELDEEGNRVIGAEDPQA